MSANVPNGMPQLASINGQIFMIAPNQRYMVHNPVMVPSQYVPIIAQQLRQQTPPQLQPQSHLQPQSQLQQQHSSLQPSQLRPQRSPGPPQPLTKDQTNARVRGIQEKAISHFIDGQIILESAKPLNDKATKSGLKKKRKKNSTQQAELKPQTPQSPQVTEGSSTIQEVLYDVQTVRAKMPNWSVAEVVKFIEAHEDISEYASKFAEDEIDGKALQLMIDRNLNFQVLASMFKHGPAMKIEAALSKYKGDQCQQSS